VKGLQLLRRSIKLLTLLCVAGCVVGQVFRDRTLPTALMFYFPPILMGIGAIAIDLLCRGRTIRRPRYFVTLVGLLLICLQIAQLFRWGPAPRARAAGEILVLQWNVMWGGSFNREIVRTWPKLAARVRDTNADLIVLSEAPFGNEAARFAESMGWSIEEFRGAEPSGYLFRQTVMSRFPLRVLRRDRWGIGCGMLLEMDTPEGTLRTLVVDGLSQPWATRAALFDRITETLEEDRKAGGTVDLILGDFNTPAGAVGFDRLNAAPWSFVEASDFTRGWRATWRSSLPLWSIDHVLVGPRWSVAECRMIGAAQTDHLGHVVRIARREVR